MDDNNYNWYFTRRPINFERSSTGRPPQLSQRFDPAGSRGQSATEFRQIAREWTFGKRLNDLECYEINIGF
jgi:hypothetical protein